MTKPKLYDFETIFEVNYCFDLCKQKKEFLKILETSIPQKVHKFDSTGTEWDLGDVDYYWFGINGGKIFISSIVLNDIELFFEFLIQMAQTNKKDLILGIDNEGSYSAVTSLSIDENNIRFTIYDFGLMRNKKILSDIIINKKVFLQQFYDILNKLYTDTLKENYPLIQYTQKSLKKCLDEFSKYLQVEIHEI